MQKRVLLFMFSMCYDNSITEMSLLQKRENIKKAENKGGFVLDGKNNSCQYQ